jgi:hypothetical protein
VYPSAGTCYRLLRRKTAFSFQLLALSFFRPLRAYRFVPAS